MKVWLVVNCILLSVQALGQQRVHFNITQQNGLPSNTVYNIFQDSKGFLWVATENGLARYNGVFFKRYNNTEVRSTAVSYLSEDNAGRIWLHNFFGEILFVENDTLKKLHSWEDKYTEGFPNISTLGDTLLISSAQALFYYFTSEKTWQHIAIDDKEPINYNHHTEIDGVQWLCYGTASHTIVKSINNKHQPVYRLEKRKFKIGNNVVRLLAWQKTLWLFDASNKYLLELADGKTRDLSKEYNNELSTCRQVINIGDSLLAFAGTNGVYFHANRGKRQHLLPGKNVSSVTADREGGLWIGTLNEGLYYVPPGYSLLYPKEQYGLFTKLAEDSKRDRLIAGSYIGKTEFISPDGLIERAVDATAQKEVQSLFVDTLTDQLFVFNSTLKSYDLKTGRQTNEQHIAAVKEMARVKQNLALATSAGLYLYNPLTHEYDILFNNQRITTVAYDESNSILWVGAQKGIYTYNIQNHTAQLWLPVGSSLSPGASRLRILADGTVAVGTLTNGLYLLKNGTQRHLTAPANIPSNRITALVENENMLWIGTDNGILRYNMSDQSTITINKTKGLAAAEVYDMKLVNEKLWVSNAAGLQVFDVLAPPNTEQPIIHLQTVESGNEQIVTHDSKLVLEPDSQQLTLKFDVSNSLKSHGQTRILYRITEIDGDQWNEISLLNPVINYASLPFGKFSFEAKALNEDGIESSNQIALAIHVKAPFWKQFWFVALMFVLSACLIIVLIYMRLRKNTEENRRRLQQLNQQQELRIARLTSIRAQMNPHFIFNTMSLIQGKVLNGLQDDANRSIQNFSMLVRKVLDFSGREMITLQEEIEVLEKYLAIENDRFNGELQYSIELNDDAAQELIRIPSLLTQPFVENALRHGLMHKEGKKKLQVKFELDNSILSITIDDNGVGRKASAEFNKSRRPEHTSFAIDAYQKRIDLLNISRRQKIKLEIIDKQNEYGRSEGTAVVITLPLHDGEE